MLTLQMDRSALTDRPVATPTEYGNASWINEL